jgi:hypothetical protein
MAAGSVSAGGMTTATETPGTARINDRRRCTHKPPVSPVTTQGRRSHATGAEAGYQPARKPPLTRAPDTRISLRGPDLASATLWP